MSENTNLVKRNAGPSLTPFEAINLNRLKIIHLGRTGIPCSIWRLNWRSQAFSQWNRSTTISFMINSHTQLLKIRVYLITCKKLRSFAFANRDSCFNTTILSCELPLQWALYITWSKSVQHFENYNTRILDYLQVKGNPSQSLLIERPSSFNGRTCCMMVYKVSLYFAYKQIKV